MNTVVDAIYPAKEAHSYKWKIDGKFPFFSTEDEQFAIDTARGFLYRKGNQVVPLPQNLFESDLLKPFLTNAKEQIAVQKQPGQYEWTDPEGLQIRVAQKDGLIVQREIKKNIWVEKLLDSTQFPVQGLLEKHDLWVEIGTSPQIYWVASKESGAPLYRMTQNDRGHSIHALDPATPWELALPAEGSVFDQIDEKGYVIIWKNQTTKEVAAVEAPRLDLIFLMKKGKLTLPKYDGFFVSETQRRLFNADYRNSIVMENGLGEEKLFFQIHFIRWIPLKELEIKTYLDLMFQMVL